MSTDFVIINPPASKANVARGKYLPLGALYLADSLMNTGYSVDIFDDTVENIKRALKNTVSDSTLSVGISTLSGVQLSNAISIAKFLKSHYPQKPIIWGGAHVTALPKQTLESELVDFVVWGEGENSLPQLLKGIQNNSDLSKIQGIGYKIKGKAIITEKSDYTEIDDKVFKLPYHLLKMDNYARKMSIGVDRCFLIYSSRGCPFNCKFCSNTSSVWLNTKMRYHSIDSIVNDVSTLFRQYGADAITFSDENLFVNEDRLINICKTLQKHNFNIKYRTAGRADLLSRLKASTWQLLKETGFVAMGVGIESGSQRILDYIGKGITLEQIYKVDDLLTKYNFYKTYNFMTCVPGEMIEDVRDTLRLILHLAKSSEYSPYPFSMLFKYIPLPGTKLFDIAIEWGFKPPACLDDWTMFDCENVENTIKLVRPWLSSELLIYAIEANRLIEELNSLHIGVGLNKAKIRKVFDKIEALINQ